MNIGSYLKQLRIEKDYTLNDVANKLGLSVSFISQLENMKLSPSLESLEKLLEFYAVNLSDFFRQIEQKRVIIVKKADSKTLEFLDEKMKITLLASKLHNNSLESFIVKFDGEAHFATAVLPREVNGERIIYVIEGRIYASLDKSESITLETGDSVNYKSYVPCTINSVHDIRSSVFISGMPPLIIPADSQTHI